MASKQRVEVQPKELRFTFEPNKESTCVVRFSNNTLRTVAFKVKTNSPKKYKVHPCYGILLPDAVIEFKVVMEAQTVAPPGLVCKDKFLVQTKFVLEGTSIKDITSDMFSKENAAHLEETLVRVVLVGPSESPLSSSDIDQARDLPMPVFTTPVHLLAKDSVLKLLEDEDDASLEPKKLDEEVELDKPKSEELKRREDDNNATEESKPVVSNTVVNHSNEPAADSVATAESKQQEPAAGKDVEYSSPSPPPPPSTDVNLATVEEKPQLSVSPVEAKLANEIEAVKSKLVTLEHKFNEGQSTNSNLIQEGKTLTEELAKLKDGMLGGTEAIVEAKLPILQVVVITLIGILFGYLCHFFV